MQIPFRRDFEFQYAVVETLSPWLRRVVARNPSRFTFHGTGTYIVGRGRVAIIDPGPNLDEHVNTILQGLEGEEITHLLVTHTHRDHSPACGAVQAACGAKTYGFGPHGGDRVSGDVQVEEGADMAFTPDVAVRDGDVIEGESWSFECVHTPGHTSNHICYQLREQRALFSGDHVMGWSTSIISPPDGDMAAYMASLARLLERNDEVYWPTHGPCIDNPRSHVRAFVAHRREREEQILDCLAGGIDCIEEMVPIIYQSLDAEMHPAAARQVLGAVIYLGQQGRVSCEGPPSLQSRWCLQGDRLDTIRHG